MLDVITIGAATRDVYIMSKALDVHDSDDPNFKIEACFPLGTKIDIDDMVIDTGGGATNAAATFSRIGFSSAAICAVGGDSTGREVIAELKKEGIGLKFVQQVKGLKTGYSIVITAGSGERTVMVHRGAARAVDPESVPWKKIRSRWMYITSLGGNLEMVEKALKHAEKNGIQVAWNPGNSELKLGLDKLSHLIEKVDIFNLNREEASVLTGIKTERINDILSNLKGLPKIALLVTDGMGGTYAAERNGANWHSGVVDVPRINTTGAGDAFGSGFIAGMLEKPDVRHALAVGTLNATGCIQQIGAKRGLLEGLPGREETEKIPLEPWI